MAINQVQTGQIYTPTGQAGNQRGGNYGDTIVSQYGGKYSQLAKDGLLFNYSVKTAAAILLSATTGNVPTIWNPAGSGIVVYICKLMLNFLSGTTTISSLQWMVTKNAGSGIAATAPVVTFTNQAPDPAIAGAPFTSKVLFSPAVSTYVAAPAFFASTGINLGAVAPSAGSGNYDEDFDGAIAIYPGTALSLCSSVTTTTSLWFTTIIGAELPL